jgi:uncharacterized membrane protein YecN with MAPEG domain
MLALIRLAVVAIALVMLTQVAFASDGPAATPSPAGIHSVSLDATPLILAQSSDSSSSGSYYIPRGLIRLAIFGVIGLFSAGAWVVRKISGS